MNDAVRMLLKRYLADQSPDNFMRLRDAVANSPGYQPYSDSIASVYELIDQENYEEARSRLMAMMPNLILNPGIHKLLSFVLHQLDKTSDSQAEFALGMLCAQGILSTGEGSEAKPYLVLHTSDEYDILEHLGKQSHGQALVVKGDRHLDRLDCSDGSQVWFDATIPFSHLGRRMAGHQEN